MKNKTTWIGAGDIYTSRTITNDISKKAQQLPPNECRMTGVQKMKPGEMWNGTHKAMTEHLTYVHEKYSGFFIFENDTLQEFP